MVILQTVKIPGYAEAVRKENHARDTAYLDALECVCGVWVAPLCLRSLVALEAARNGHVETCQWESEQEAMGHAVQVLYFCRPEFKVPTRVGGFWWAFFEARRQWKFTRQVLKAGRENIIPQVQGWIRDAMMDAPGGGSVDAVPSRSFASYPTHVIDRFAEAGLPFTYDEIMTMPLRRLWQHWRIASSRLHSYSLSNPSDSIRTDYLAAHGHRN